MTTLSGDGWFGIGLLNQWSIKPATLFFKKLFFVLQPLWYKGLMKSEISSWMRVALIVGAIYWHGQKVESLNGLEGNVIAMSYDTTEILKSLEQFYREVEYRLPR